MHYVSVYINIILNTSIIYELMNHEYDMLIYHRFLALKSEANILQRGSGETSVGQSESDSCNPITPFDCGGSFQS